MPRTRPNQSDRGGEHLLSVAELADYLGVPIATVYRWRYQRQGPLGYRIGRHVRFRSSDVQRWLERQRDAESR